jgi:Domain of unknown function (DUF4252)
MKKRIAAILLGAFAVAMPALAQSSPLPLPSAVEKELAARASDVTEVTLGKNMLAFASKFMDGKDNDDAAARQLIQNLDGIYVREYQFDKEGQYSADQIEQLRKSFETPEWSSIVRERDRKSGESTDILMKMVNGESRGMFILETEPKELTIVLILGPIKMDDLSKLHGIGGLDALSYVDRPDGMKVKEKGKAKDKVKTDGDDQ